MARRAVRCTAAIIKPAAANIAPVAPPAQYRAQWKTERLSDNGGRRSVAAVFFLETLLAERRAASEPGTSHPSAFPGHRPLRGRRLFAPRAFPALLRHQITRWSCQMLAGRARSFAELATWPQNPPLQKKRLRAQSSAPLRLRASYPKLSPVPQKSFRSTPENESAAVKNRFELSKNRTEAQPFESHDRTFRRNDRSNGISQCQE